MILSNQLIPLLTDKDIETACKGLYGEWLQERRLILEKQNELYIAHNNKILNARIDNDKTF
jgi:hypothetical protein